MPQPTSGAVATGARNDAFLNDIIKEVSLHPGMGISNGCQTELGQTRHFRELRLSQQQGRIRRLESDLLS